MQNYARCLRVIKTEERERERVAGHVTLDNGELTLGN